MRRALAAALLALLAAAPAAAGAETRTAQAGGVRAALVSDDQTPSFVPRLRVERGATVFEDEPARCGEDGTFCESPYPEEEALSVRDLDADGEPEVVLSLYSRGAHCCVRGVVYRWDGATYVATSRSFADADFRLRDLGDGGAVEWVTRDARFAYVFGGFGDSRFPVRVLHWAAGAWSDVSRGYRAELRRDARRHWRTYLSFRRRDYDCEGVLAAWMADKVRLGEAAEGWRRIRAADRRGDLEPGGRVYVRRLRRHLALFGYTAR